MADPKDEKLAEIRDALLRDIMPGGVFEGWQQARVDVAIDDALRVEREFEQ